MYLRALNDPQAVVRQLIPIVQTCDGVKPDGQVPSVGSDEIGNLMAILNTANESIGEQHAQCGALDTHDSNNLLTVMVGDSESIKSLLAFLRCPSLAGQVTDVNEPLSSMIQLDQSGSPLAWRAYRVPPCVGRGYDIMVAVTDSGPWNGNQTLSAAI